MAIANCAWGAGGACRANLAMYILGYSQSCMAGEAGEARTMIPEPEYTNQSSCFPRLRGLRGPRHAWKVSPTEYGGAGGDCGAALGALLWAQVRLALNFITSCNMIILFRCGQRKEIYWLFLCDRRFL